MAHGRQAKQNAVQNTEPRSENVTPGGECKKRKLYGLVGLLLSLQKQALWLESNLFVAHEAI